MKLIILRYLIGAKTIIVISNNVLNNKGTILYVEVSLRRMETDLRLQLQIVNKNDSNKIDHIFVETGKISCIDSKYLCCYQGDLEELELIRLINKIKNNFKIDNSSNKINEIGNRIINSKNYSNNIELIKKLNRTTSDLTLEEKEYIINNYSKAVRDKMAEELKIYPYERMTNIANYLKTKFKKKGYL